MAKDKEAGGAHGFAAHERSKVKEARRNFLKKSSAMVALALTPPTVLKAAGIA